VTALWILLAVSVLALVVYMAWSLRKVGTPTKGPAIDRKARPQTALVVIDVQEDFTRNTGKHAFDPVLRDAALSEISREIEAGRSAGYEVAFIRNVFREWPVIAAMKLVANGIGTPGREGLKLDRTLAVGDAAVFEKSVGDTFSSPEFDAWLMEKAVGKLILVGLDACHCVQLTAKGALARGYRVEIREPATLTGFPEKWTVLKKELGALGAAIA